MTVPQPPTLEFPAMLHGLRDAVLRQLVAQGREWARDYRETGRFNPPRSMHPVRPDEALLMHAGAELGFMERPSWRIHLFSLIAESMDPGVPEEERSRMDEVFESFCLHTPWGAIHHVVSPPPMRSAERMARRFTALLRFWDALQGPRYVFRERNTLHTLDELIRGIYQVTLEAWCPGHFSSVREHLAQVAQRMARATREDSIEAMLLVIPHLLHSQPKLPHREVLGNPDFVRARLAETSPGDFEDASGADRFRVNGLLHAWSRALSRR